MEQKTYTLINSLNDERKKNLRFKFFKIIRGLNVWKGVEQEKKSGRKIFKRIDLRRKKRKERKPNE
ncbi:hypothetical protein WG947_11090 [Pontibacter sp. H259]|uniref:hypothetical protein n=1 Tax=Pontibacter sp. H259 TaxID=3133421 RepID=UPI0030C1EB42